MKYTEKRRSLTPDDADYEIRPTEGAIVFSNRLETKGGQMIMVLNREGLPAQTLAEMSPAQRRTYFLYHLLTGTDEGRSLMEFVMLADERIAQTGSMVDLSEIDPQGNA